MEINLIEISSLLHVQKDVIAFCRFSVKWKLSDHSKAVISAVQCTCLTILLHVHKHFILDFHLKKMFSFLQVFSYKRKTFLITQTL